MPFDAASYSIVLFAFGVGALHALDADHIMAVSSLAMRRTTPGRCVRLGAGWALGHGLTLLTLGCLFYALGHALPLNLHLYAERIVALLLCGVGATVLVSLLSGGAQLRLHRHPGMVAHLHWVRGGHRHERSRAEDDHGAVLLGVFHGLAGSAPMLALIPTGQRGDLASGALVLLSFSVGVLLMMLAFGLLLGGAMSHYAQILPWIRGITGGGSLVLGSAILIGSF